MNADGSPTRPSVPQPEYLHIDGDTLWIGREYKTAAIILNTNPRHDGLLRCTFYDRSDPEQRRSAVFVDKDAVLEWLL